MSKIIKLIFRIPEKFKCNSLYHCQMYQFLSIVIAWISVNAADQQSFKMYVLIQKIVRTCVYPLVSDWYKDLEDAFFLPACFKSFFKCFRPREISLCK